LSHHELTYDDLLRIVELIQSSERFSEFRLRIGEIDVELRRRSSAEPAARAAATPAPAPASAPPAATSAPAPLASTSALAPPAATSAPAVARDYDAQTPPAGSAPDAFVVRAPMVGTFYRSPQPGAPPFVEVGQPVEPETTVCIIEVMKLMNSIAAGVRGVVAQVLIDDGAPVATGAPIIVVRTGSRA
jgi:acetyl-CoA carboxylase biotin carboxyl carrier protein